MVISDAAREKIRAEMAKYPKPEGALLAALHLVQKQTGHISGETAQEIADLFGIHPIRVMEVVTFYNMFYDEPQGRHHVHVCTNLPCSLRGARELLRGLEAHLGIEAGETTKDGRVTLAHEECLGACGYAPMLRVDETYHENLDLAAAKRILDELE
ncbi:NADH-quinone oxidoreductase subunit E [Myxococcaceae bacterium]|jgi:NADH-quinone oxidoreductase subunit E|nr:NADH-quinone oxidoreductase subunit E [Myxococcaceae bacterium]